MVKSSKKGSTPIILPVLALILIVTLAGVYMYKYRKQNSSSDSYKTWNTYNSKEYGFTVMYPQSWAVKSSGPNSSMQQKLNGEQVSGTLVPSYDTLVFSGQGAGKVLIDIFDPYNKPLTVQSFNNDYLYTMGPCDLRSDFVLENSANLSISGNNSLKVQGKIGQDSITCYYIENTKEAKNYLLVVSSAPSATEADKSTMENIVQSVAFESQ